MRKMNIAMTAAALTVAGLAASPALALKDPPRDVPASSSGGGSTSGGSTSGGSTSGGTAVPEPASILLFGAGAVGFMAARRRRRKDEV